MERDVAGNGNRKQWGQREEQRNADASQRGGQTQHKTWERAKDARGQSCLFCGGGHRSDDCSKVPSLEGRRKVFNEKRWCWGCAGDSHTRRFCQKNSPCFHCKKVGHHSSICEKRFGNEKERVGAAAEDKVKADIGPLAAGHARTCTDKNCKCTAQNACAESHALAAGTRSLLHMAVTVAEDVSGLRSKEVRVLLDGGCQRSYITKEVAKALQLVPIRQETIGIQKFGETKYKDTCLDVVEVKLRHKDGSSKVYELAVQDHIMGPVRRATYDADTLRVLLTKRRWLADTIPTDGERDVTLDVALGGDHLLSCITGGIDCFLNAAKTLGLWTTVFGLVVMGTMNCDSAVPSRAGNNVSSALACSVLPLSDPVENLWRLETIGIQSKELTAGNDEEVSQEFERTVRFDEQEGRYFVIWPVKTDLSTLPDNWPLALVRLRSLVRKMKGNDSAWNQYADIIKDQVERSIVEPVDSTSKADGVVHYIAHHAVFKPERETTKVRIVYDAAAKQKPTCPCLNDLLYRGPVILEDLAGLLCRFRLGPIAICADIEKAFLMIGLRTDQRDCCRFLWLKDPDKRDVEDNIQVFRFTRVCFGVVSSPFLLGATLQHHFNSMPGHTSELMKNSCYADNIIVNVLSFEAGKQYYRDAKEIIRSAGMNLRQFATNSMEVLESIPVEDRCKYTVYKVLGIMWSLSNDMLTIFGAHAEHLLLVRTKRDLLGAISGTFDPLGLVCPVTIVMRVFFQRILPSYTKQKSMKDKEHWDMPLSTSDKEKWLQLVKEYQPGSSVTLPRYLGFGDASSGTFWLISFTDASRDAYACTVYLSYRGADGSGPSRLLFAKARVAPKCVTRDGMMPEVSMPRMELLGILCGVRAINFLDKELRVPVTQHIVFTDSQVCVHWIHSPRTLSPFVENRLREIRMSKATFRYVRSECNPADMASRGVTTAVLQNSNLWWEGPAWLSSQFETWPKEMEPVTEAMRVATEHEERKSAPFFVAPVIEQQSKPPFAMDISRFSSFLRLLRTTAWASRAATRFRHGNVSFPPELSVDEVNSARLIWDRYVQQAEFAGSCDKKCAQLFQNLNLYKDANGLLRSKGRLDSAGLSQDTTHPKLLPPNHAYTRLIIMDAHKSILHGGVGYTLAKVRESYWIPRGRAIVKSTLMSCGLCRKHKSIPYKIPSFPIFPTPRVKQTRPFEYTGADYFGPLYVKDSTERSRKVWVCLYTCLSTRAVHLELVLDLSAEQFLGLKSRRRDTF